MVHPTSSSSSFGADVVPPSPRSRLPRGLVAFRHRNYRIFWFAQLISLTGTWMQAMAQSWLVLTMTDSAFQLGLVNVFQFAPTLLLGLVGGVIADRMPKRRLLRVTQSISAMLVGILAMLVVTDAVQLWHIYTIAGALGIVNAFDMPTRQAFVAEIVGKDDLLNAVAMNSALFNTTRVLGPAIAGVLLAQTGAAVCFVLNAVSYLPVIAGLTMMRLPARLARDERHSGIERLQQGLRYVRQTPVVLVPLTLVGIVATFGMNFNVWVPLLAKNDFAIGASGFGLLMSSMGIGSLMGALTLAFMGRAPLRGPMLAAAAAFGLLETGLAIAGATVAPVAVAVAMMAGVGFTMSTAMALANTTVQTTTPDALRGRVMSIYMTVFAGTAPIGSLISGLTAHQFGTPASVALGGIAVLLAAVGLAIWSSRLAPAAGASLPTGPRGHPAD